MAEFATLEQVAELTGVTVDAPTRLLAAQAVEIATGLIEGTLAERVDISDRDLYFLRLMCSYQAAWLMAQPDYLTRNDVATASQDGQSATGGAHDWLTLSPLARKASKRLSWRGTRPLATGTLSRAERLALALRESGDDRETWRPIA